MPMMLRPTTSPTATGSASYQTLNQTLFDNVFGHILTIAVVPGPSTIAGVVSTFHGQQTALVVRMGQASPSV